MNKSIENKTAYDEEFPDDKQSLACVETLKEKALEHALDIRKFEIELYWKRATYFWAFIAATFAGYLGMATSDKKPSPDIFVLICALGLSFSVAWYFVNRGSKFWQNNWERHVDLLENEIIGPLYKTAIDTRTCYFRRLHKEYPFSVSKINQILSLYILAIWIYLSVKSISTVFEIKEPFAKFNSIAVVLITVVFMTCFFVFARTDQGEKVKLKNRDKKIMLVRKSFFDPEK
jgi:hypothetical protein